MFADSLLFDMMLNTTYEDGIDTIQDLIDREMSLGITFYRSMHFFHLVDRNLSKKAN